MRFKPMEFGAPDSSICKPHQGLALQLPRPPSPITLTKKREDADTGSSCNRLNVGNISNKLKMHPLILLQTLLNKPSQRLMLWLRRERKA